jgi:hypothetical protein
MGVQTKFENARAALRKPPAGHPCAIPPIPGGQGLWLIRQGEAPALGYVRQRPVTGGFAFDVYAHCRDEGGRRPWLHTAPSLNSAVAWTLQHDADVRALIARSTAEPDPWPPPAPPEPPVGRHPGP